jgi:hypothetical protein
MSRPLSLKNGQIGRSIWEMALVQMAIIRKIGIFFLAIVLQILTSASISITVAVLI